MFSKKRVLILFSFSVSLLLSVGFINQVEASSNQGIVELKNIESIDMSKIDSLEKKSPQEMQAIYNKIANDFDSNVLPNISEKRY